MQFGHGFRHDLLWRNHRTALQWAPTLTAHDPSPPMVLLEPLAPPVNTVLPVITTDGTPQVTETISCSTGTWSNTPTSYAYRWTRDGVDISGATSSTYTIQVADDSHVIACRVTATNADGSASATATGVTPTQNPPVNSVAPAVSTDGTPATGETVTCSTGTWSNSPSFAYQWKRAGSNISGATSSSYALQVADETLAIKCTVTAANTGGSASQDSNTITPTAQPPVNSVAPVVTTDGTPQSGETISCSTGTWSGSPSFAYQWKRAGSAISGATSSTYALQVADQSQAVKCTVTATNSGGSVAQDSNTITVLPGAPANTVAPVVTTDGTPATGETISCSTGTWSNSPTSYTYQWKRAGSAISGATTATYALQVADEGQPIKCAVTAANAGGSGTPTDSNTVTPIAQPPVNTVAPVVTTDGSPATGDTISCSAGTWTGSPTSFDYQWRRNGVIISGANLSNYTLQSADEGQSIRCTVTAWNTGGSTPQDSNTITPGGVIVFLHDLEFNYVGQERNVFTKDLVFDYEGRDTVHFTLDVVMMYTVAVPHGRGTFRRRREMVR